MILRFEPAKAPYAEADVQLSLIKSFETCRQQSLTLINNIQPSLIKQQAHPDFSPVGWHLGHIAYTESLWILEKMAGSPCPFPHYRRLFSADGLPKVERENLPELEEILAYLAVVRSRTLYTLNNINTATHAALLHWLLQHESQHAETIAIVTALHSLKEKDQAPISYPNRSSNNQEKDALNSIKDPMVYIEAGAFTQGCNEIVAIDNEKPAHQVWLNDYWIDRRPVTCQQYHRFIAAGGYQQKQWWTAAGWRWQQLAGVEKPLYWPDDYAESGYVQGVSWYEADAYARFVGKRLPSESEWAKAANCFNAYGCEDMLGSVWQWTNSLFEAYAGFKPFPYAGYSQAYFDQAHRVLRGGSWATPQWALRKSFRNWYHPHRREMFAGFRCAA
ncbi:MAG: SUMF1/EgtB/PvdO family nonheme iron enzyme [Phormidesmis sp.]